mgnify:CR=1 FL=1
MSEIFATMKRLVLEAGELLEDRELSDNVTVKGDADYVTMSDFTVQERLRERLADAFPDVAFVAEEKKANAYDPSGRAFILDPVDGTTNLLHGFRYSAISLGYYENGVPTAGVIYNPFLKELYTAQRGCGAALNGRTIHARERHSLHDCLAIVEFSPYYKHESDHTFRMMHGLFDKVQDIRSMGAAAIDLMQLASGRADVFMSKKLQPWDYAAAQVILIEAGCRVSCFDGSELRMDRGCDIIAAADGGFEELAKYAEEFA